MIKKVTASEKKKLKEQLKVLDKKLSGYYKFYKYTMSIAYNMIYPKEFIKLQKLDEKRKQIRNKLK